MLKSNLAFSIPFSVFTPQDDRQLRTAWFPAGSSEIFGLWIPTHIPDWLKHPSALRSHGWYSPWPSHSQRYEPHLNDVLFFLSSASVSPYISLFYTVFFWPQIKMCSDSADASRHWPKVRIVIDYAYWNCNLTTGRKVYDWNIITHPCPFGISLL